MQNENLKTKYIYHYTTIEALVLILKYKCLKFNTLNVLDDMEEGETQDIKDFGKFCYVSCWTNEHKESIALWNMYSKDMHGIRIGLPIEMIDFDRAMENIPKFFEDNGLKLVKQKNNTSIIPLTKVNYSKNLKKEKDEVLKVNGKKLKLDLTKFGVLKNSDWQFQNEFRFMVYSAPKNIDEILNLKLDDARKTLQNYVNPVKFVYVPIKDEAIKNIKILMGPRCSESLREVVNLLVKVHNLNPENITRSALKIR